LCKRSSLKDQGSDEKDPLTNRGTFSKETEYLREPTHCCQRNCKISICVCVCVCVYVYVCMCVCVCVCVRARV